MLSLSIPGRILSNYLMQQLFIFGGSVFMGKKGFFGGGGCFDDDMIWVLIILVILFCCFCGNNGHDC